MRKRLKPWFQPVKLRIICETKNCFSIVLRMRQAKWHFRHSRWYVGKKTWYLQLIVYQFVLIKTVEK